MSHDTPTEGENLEAALHQIRDALRDLAAQDEARAWDRFLATAMINESISPINIADQMLAARRKRFGGGG